ncbi:hypothetical protein CNMCM6936_003638 [Aspergillus lentulus]|uniref:Uncharacterized protein n=1 Tax=Aspergillus lentulus TaxID=293939 RepID=A0AAN5YQ93_ASPLE|nr:hypothetical protein CNMCM6936_003638 [Aspergillus lentulus]KAF4171542.1 hypothetical protein CNMCM8060_002811 [Aspergillus lentulus]KAF4183534.1 hypothetical protein CNMCM7927_009011 [Aspergillus lentulus]KAF4189749.1 hypothetical protein CNMCM8694_003953 [Aspergillus lentulus]KAF4206003.1 hypothetical protein CNMCM8927_005409 [Aspergillus lentulus]
MSRNQNNTPTKDKEPKKLEDLEDNTVIEIVTHSLQRDNLAPGGLVLRENFSALDRRHLPYPKWRCNECHFEFATAKLRDRHEASHWHTSGGESLGMSFMGHQALLDRIPEPSRQLVLEEFINSPRDYKHDGLPPAPDIYRVPYIGTEEASTLKSS